MIKITQITPGFAVTGALLPDQIAEVAALGFKSIVSNLPDGESPRHPSSAEEAQLAAKAGLGFRHIPVTKAEALSERVAEDMREALGGLEGPVLAHCASGLRSGLAWAAAAALSEPAARVVTTAVAAGIRLEPILDDLHALHDPARAGDTPGPLRTG